MRERGRERERAQRSGSEALMVTCGEDNVDQLTLLFVLYLVR